MSAVKGRVSIYDTMENLGAEVVAFIEKRFAEMYFLCKENIALVKLKPLTELLVEVEAYDSCGGEPSLSLTHTYTHTCYTHTHTHTHTHTCTQPC